MSIVHHKTPEDILRIMEEHVPFCRLLGIRGESAGPGRAVMVLPIRPELIGDPRRPSLHGGVVATLLDTCGGVAAWSVLPPGEWVTTVDMRVDYLVPAGVSAPLRAEAELIHRGNRVCHVRMRATQGDVLVAEGHAVFNIHRQRTTEAP